MAEQENTQQQQSQQALTRLDIIRLGMKRARSVNEKKEGRPYGVNSAEELEQLFDEYVMTIQRAPMFISVRKQSSKGTEKKDEKVDRPITEAGFCLFCGHTASWLKNMMDNLKAKTRNSQEDELLESATRIRDAIRCDLIDGGLLGAYQSNFTARVLGLADRQTQEQITRQIVVKDEKERDMVENLRNSDV